MKVYSEEIPVEYIRTYFHVGVYIIAFLDGDLNWGLFWEDIPRTAVNSQLKKLKKPGETNYQLQQDLLLLICQYTDFTVKVYWSSKNSIKCDKFSSGANSIPCLIMSFTSWQPNLPQMKTASKETFCQISCLPIFKNYICILLQGGTIGGLKLIYNIN